MKKALTLGLLLMLAAAGTAQNSKATAQGNGNATQNAAIAAQESGEWRLVWHDEFDGTGAPDSTKWQSEYGFVRNEEAQWYQPENAYLLGGVLVLEGRCDSVPNPHYRADAPADWRNRPYAQYSSASINTRGKFSFQYGRMEVRARIPAVCGAWPAIWTLGTAREWPSCGECDVMEFYQIDGAPHILANAAWGDDRRFHAVWNSTKTPYSHFLEKDRDWGEKFHIWVMDWSESAIRIYLDGELLNDIDLRTTQNGRLGDYANPFQQPHYILLNLAIGGINGGEPQADAFPMRYEIDYVRVYEKR